MSRLPAADLALLAERHAPLWRELDGARLFITGGTGFFGRWLVDSALHAREALGVDLTITLLSRAPDEALARQPHWAGQPGLAWVEGDVRNFAHPAGPFSHIIHAATDTRPDQQADGLDLLDTIVGGTRHVLDLAARCGARRVLYASSGAVYGRSRGQPPLAEDMPLAPDSLDPAASYSIGKRYAEHLGLLLARAQGIGFVAARCFAFVGPGLPLDGHFAIGNFIHDALAAPAIVLKGDGTPLRSYLYGADLAVWLYTLLLRGNAGRAYNVGAEQAVTLTELAHLVRDTLSPGKNVLILGTPVPGQAPDSYIPDTRRARQELGLATWTPLAAAIRNTADWLRSQPSAQTPPQSQDSP